jgi:hypothetical protein
MLRSWYVLTLNNAHTCHLFEKISRGWETLNLCFSDDTITDENLAHLARLVLCVDSACFKIFCFCQETTQHTAAAVGALLGC